MIVTKRMTLKPTGPEYFDGLWRAIERSADELRVWMDWAIEPDPKNSRQYTIDAAKEWEEGSDRHFHAVPGRRSLRSMLSDACGPPSLPL